MESIIQMPGYRINEYRLVIPLPEALQEKIINVRKSLHEKYKVKLPFELKPCLTILKCNAFEKIESRLMENIQQVAMHENPFKVDLEDFAGYPSHTIYINVPNRSPFNQLCKELKKLKWMMNIPGHEPHFISEPHLVIAQQLKPAQFTNMWRECENRPFTGKFIADAMLLVKQTQEKRYQVCRRFEFMSLPSNIKQGELFA